MQRTRIEWVKNQDGSQGYTINPVKGLCPVACKDNQGKEYCYARRMYKRFKWNPEIRIDYEVFNPIWGLLKSSHIFVGSTMELFGEWILPRWMEGIFRICQVFPQHTFIFLTKQPQNLIKWSPFPSNTYIGVSVTNQEQYEEAIGSNGLDGIEAKVKFLSFEPLLELVMPSVYRLNGISWVVIGQVTPVQKVTMPKIEWVQEIVEACDNAGIPVFLKDNLRSLFAPLSYEQCKWACRDIVGNPLRQEFPKR